MRNFRDQRPKIAHPYAWIWEPLAEEPTFVLRPMFGGRALYLDGRLMLFFVAKEDPWRGMLVCTEREHHEWLRARFPALAPHEVLPKWLYLPETHDAFERSAAALTELARRRDPRMGILASPKKKSKARGKKSRPK